MSVKWTPDTVYICKSLFIACDVNSFLSAMHRLSYLIRKWTQAIVLDKDIGQMIFFKSLDPSI